MKDKSGLVLYRKFGESLLIDNHIMMTPLYYLSVFQVGDIEYKLSYIEEWNSLDNVIKVESGWAWALTRQMWNPDYCSLILTSVIDIAKREYGRSGIQMNCVIGEEPSVPHGFMRFPIPKFIGTSVVVEMCSEESDTEDDGMNLTLNFGETQEIYYHGFRATVGVDGFRGVGGACLRFVAAQEHSIVRCELLNRKARK